MSRKLVGEFLGTAILLFVVVGSGIVVEQRGADPAAQLFMHAIAVGAGLGVAIAMFLPLSGSYFNPVVTMVFLLDKSIDGATAAWYIAAQLSGAIVGVVLANATFGLDAVSISTNTRDGTALLFSETIGTFILILAIFALVRTGRTSLIPVAIAAIVFALVVSTSSTGFMNPAVTISRMFTDTYTGIAPASVPMFVVVEIVGALAAFGIAHWIFPNGKDTEGV